MAWSRYAEFRIVNNPCTTNPWSWYMMTSSNGNIFRVTGPLCGEFTGPSEFLTQRPVRRSFGVFFDLRLNKRLSKQPWGWWFETLSWSLWRQCNETPINSFPSNAAYMRQWTGLSLVRVMACRCSAPSHYLNQCWFVVNRTSENKLQWNLNWQSISFIQENAFEIVACQNGGHLSKGRWAN